MRFPLPFFLIITAIALMFGAASQALATEYFVKIDGDDTVAGTNWALAFLTISNAVAQTEDGDTVTVSNGTYDTVAHIKITNGITVQSVNGATNTIVNRSAIGTNAPQHRIFYLNHANAVVDGFTITNGYLGNAWSDGGGAYTAAGGTLRNCTLTGNYAGRDGGGAYVGILYDCTIVGNCAVRYGGGARGGTLYNCTIVGNVASNQGGGVMYGTLSNCMIVGNSAPLGGGVDLTTVYNSIIVSNSATGDNTAGGGAYGGTLYNCTLSYNSAPNGGGSGYSTMYNCLLIGNRAFQYYGGGFRGLSGTTLYNCTIVGNSSASSGGGVSVGTFFNCISWGNNKVDHQGTWYYSDAAGITGDGTITSDPLFITDGSGYGLSHETGNYRLSKGSPCINTGTNFSWMTDPGVRSKDLDGSPRIDYPFSSQVDMGCYEYVPAGIIFSTY